MTIASIDIGSNTIILLIAKYDANIQFLFPILNSYHVPRIGEGLVNSGKISDDAIVKLINGLEDFFSLIQIHKADIVLVNATNAMRIAENSIEIKELIKKKFNWNVEIISGEKEAELTFNGIILPTENPSEEIITIDIGGGSTEICFGSLNKLIFRKSYNLGIVSIFNNIIIDDPPTKNEIAAIRNEIKKVFSGISIHIPCNKRAIAVAGTPTTLASILVNVTSYEDELIEGVELNQHYLTSFIDSIASMRYSEILKKYGKLVKGREDLILIGTIILYEFMKIVGIEKVSVSSKGLRYGAIWDYLIRNKKYNLHL